MFASIYYNWDKNPILFYFLAEKTMSINILKKWNLIFYIYLNAKELTRESPHMFTLDLLRTMAKENEWCHNPVTPSNQINSIL
jgi:hypothetical protein